MKSNLIKGRICRGDRTFFSLIMFGVLSCIFLLLIINRELPDYINLPNPENEKNLQSSLLLWAFCVVCCFIFYFLVKTNYWLLEFTPGSIKIRNKFDGRIKTEILLTEISSINIRGNLYFLHTMKNRIQIDYLNKDSRQPKRINLFGYGLPEWAEVLHEFDTRNIPYTTNDKFFLHIEKTYPKGKLHLEYKFDIKNIKFFHLGK